MSRPVRRSDTAVDRKCTRKMALRLWPFSHIMTIPFSLGGEPMPKRPIGTILTGIGLDRASPIPLHRQLYEALREAILTRRLLPGARLPSTRTLARELGISRYTVVDAFQQLLA